VCLLLSYFGSLGVRLEPRGGMARYFSGTRTSSPASTIRRDGTSKQVMSLGRMQQPPVLGCGVVPRPLASVHTKQARQGQAWPGVPLSILECIHSPPVPNSPIVQARMHNCTVQTLAKQEQTPARHKPHPLPSACEPLVAKSSSHDCLPALAKSAILPIPSQLFPTYGTQQAKKPVRYRSPRTTTTASGLLLHCRLWPHPLVDSPRRIGEP
jgi:hypothetical protein